ncbi:MAG TPA: LacI family DNA-binding transcriptional regulator, partial [Jatrophihabitantaceae bacterium]|nr:LacI family DNA-binding transcriptional regulator [Jatrophihabitantaceae bacterium]
MAAARRAGHRCDLAGDPPRLIASTCKNCRMLAGMARRLAEVADKVGVSEATVSRVLNGKPGVSEA